MSTCEHASLSTGDDGCWELGRYLLWSKEPSRQRSLVVTVVSLIEFRRHEKGSARSYQIGNDMI